MKVLDLFSGIGGFSLGLEAAGMETAAFCEREPFCQAVLRKHWPNTPIHSDITELDGYEYRGTVQLVCGGFPCQPFSVAGQQRGAEDDRALWPQMLRVICEVQPTWVIGENVTGIISMELDTVLSDLEREGYSCQTFVIPACAVDAKHRRDRVWIIAYANSEGEPDDSQHEQRLVGNSEHDGSSSSQISRGNGETPRPSETKRTKKTRESERTSGSEHNENVADSSGEPRWSGAIHRESSDERRGARQAGGESIQSKDRQSQSNNSTTSGENVADTESLRMERRQEFRGIDSFGTRSVKQPQRCFNNSKPAIWEPEPNVGRVVDGVSNRTHRLKSLGNAVVPQVVEQIGKAIMAIR